MKIRKSDANRDIDVNITPLIDVVFLLLIFFMVTTTFMRESEIELSLPQANGEPIERQQRPFELAIDSQGEYKIDDQIVLAGQVNDLKIALHRAREGRENLPFIIRADGRAPHQSVVWAMDAASQLNIQRIAFATVTEENSVEPK